MTSTVTRAAYGFPIRHKGTAIDESGAEVTVEWGIANTYFTCPAKRMVGRKGVYGFITTDETDDGTQYRKFVVCDDQSEAKKSYRASIQF
jgi:hypothetical protein